MPLAEQDRADLTAWLSVSLTHGLGPVYFRQLLSEFGSPDAILGATHAHLARVVPAAVASELSGGDRAAQIERALAWAARDNHRILTLADADYPRQLLEISDPAPLLYVVGSVALLSRPILAVVGSRNASPQGEVNAEQFSAALSGSGLTIISGLALGVDAAAHRGGLAGRGSTIAVMGTGPDTLYPPRNLALGKRIAAEGTLITEFPLGTPPLSGNFPRRNRLISGLARGVLVVEAALGSGSLISARLAAEQGRDVFAIPGSIHSPVSRGCHALIKQGAKLVESAQDVLEELRIMPASSANSSMAPSKGPSPAPYANTSVASSSRPSPGSSMTPLAMLPPHADIAPSSMAQGGGHPPVISPDVISHGSGAEDVLLQYIGYEGSDMDTLAGRSGLTAEALSAMLLELELEGKVARIPGGRYQRLA